MKKTGLLLGILAAAVLFLANGVMAYGPGNGGGCPFRQDKPPCLANNDGTPPADADLAKWQAERDAYQAATKDLVLSLREKQVALDRVMSEDTVDAAQAMALQKEISTLSAQLDQKRIEHQVRMKESGFAGPPAGRGPGAGYGCGRRGW